MIFSLTALCYHSSLITSYIIYTCIYTIIIYYISYIISVCRSSDILCCTYIYIHIYICIYIYMHCYIYRYFYSYLLMFVYIYIIYIIYIYAYIRTCMSTIGAELPFPRIGTGCCRSLRSVISYS